MLAVGKQQYTDSADDGLAFTEPIMVGRPNLPQLDVLTALIREALDNGWLSNQGPLLRRLEHKLGAVLGAAHVIAVVNATTAIQLVAKACELAGEVVVPSFTFPATAQAFTWIGLTPVFADIELNSATVTAATVEPLITDRTSAICAVATWGNVGPLEELSALASDYGIPLILDSAQALGVTYHGRQVGTFGTAEVISLHATKIVSACEGGLVVTNDDAIAERVRAMRSFGTNPSGKFTTVGTNAKMHEISAAMALAVLPSLGPVIAANRRKHTLYREYLTGVSGVVVREPSDGTASNYHYVVIEVDSAVAGIGRDELCERLAARNIHTKPYFAPGCHALEPYRTESAIHSPKPLPNTESLAARVLCLPTGPAVTDTDVASVAHTIASIVALAGRAA